MGQKRSARNSLRYFSSRGKRKRKEKKINVDTNDGSITLHNFLDIFMGPSIT
jgi:hypothetical protein